MNYFSYTNFVSKALFISALCFFSISSIAGTVTFTGGGDGTSWEDAANWDAGVPGNNDDAVIPDGFDVSLSSVDRVQSLEIQGSSSMTLEDAAAEGDVPAPCRGQAPQGWTGGVQLWRCR